MTALFDTSEDELPAAASQQRFNLDDQEDLKGWFSSTNKNTKKQIKYGVSVLKEFSNQVNTNYEDLDNKALDLHLSQFYKAARQKKGELYSIQSMNSIRYSLQCHFTESRGIDIIRGSDFIRSNQVFKALLRKLRAHGKAEVRYHPQVSEDDMERMQASLDLSTPQGLQHKVFLDILLHFPLSTSTDNLYSMRHTNFVLHQEDSGSFYTFGKNQTHQMHAMPGNLWCPVANMAKYITKLNPLCGSMWQRPKHEGNWNDDTTWYMNQPLGRNTVAMLVRKISASAGCTKNYSNKSLRLTKVTQLHNASRKSGKRSCKASAYNYPQNIEKRRKEILDTLQSTSNVIDVSGKCVGNPKDKQTDFVFKKAAPSSAVLQEIINSTMVPIRPAVKPCSATSNTIILKKIPSVVLKKVSGVIQSTCTSANKGMIQPSTTRKQANIYTADLVKGINKGMMTEQSLVKTQKEPSLSKHACTQWEDQVTSKQPPRHSTSCTSSVHELDTTAWRPEGEMERESRDGSPALYIDVESEGLVDETHKEPSEKEVPTNVPTLREEECDEDDDQPGDESGYQTFYIKEEYVDEDYIEYDDNTRNTPQQGSKQGEHLGLEPTNNGMQSTHTSPEEEAPGQGEANCIQSKKIYRLKFHLTHGMSKQILTINSLTETASGATIKDAVYSHLQCTGDGHFLQYFDNDWQEWIDLQPSMNFSGKTRLNFVRTSREVELPSETQTIGGQVMHVLYFHITLGDSKQVFAVYSRDSTASGANIKEVVCRMLKCVKDKYFLQYFDDTWQEWIDVTPCMKLKGGKRLQMVRVGKT